MIDMHKPSNLPPKPYGSPSEVSKAVRLSGRAWSFNISRNRDKDPLNICTAYINILCVYQCVSYIYIYIFIIYICTYIYTHTYDTCIYRIWYITMQLQVHIHTIQVFNTIQPLLLVMNLWLLLSDAPLGRACSAAGRSMSPRRGGDSLRTGRSDWTDGDPI